MNTWRAADAAAREFLPQMDQLRAICLAAVLAVEGEHRGQRGSHRPSGSRTFRRQAHGRHHHRTEEQPRPDAVATGSRARRDPSGHRSGRRQAGIAGPCRPEPDSAFAPICTISPNAYRGHPATCGTRQEDFREHAGSDHIILPGGAFLSQSHPKSRPSRFFWSILDLISATRASKSLACKGKRAIHRPTMGET